MSEIIKLFPNLDEQIKNPEVWRPRKYSTKIEVIDYTPEKPRSNNPVYLSMGWGGNPRVYEKVLRELGQRSRIISAKNLHGLDLESGTDEELPLGEMRKAVSILEILKVKKIAESNYKDSDDVHTENKIDAVGYSEGGMNILLAAIFNPDKFRNIVLVNPAGLLEKDSRTNLTLRFLKDFFLHLKDVKDPKSDENRVKIFRKWSSFYGSMVSSIAQNPLKAFQEVTDMSHFETRNLLLLLRDKYGINISFVFNKADSAFPPNKFLNFLDEHGFDYTLLEGRHGDFVLNAKPMTKVVIEKLDKMEADKNPPK